MIANVAGCLDAPGVWRALHSLSVWLPDIANDNLIVQDLTSNHLASYWGRGLPGRGPTARSINRPALFNRFSRCLFNFPRQFLQWRNAHAVTAPSAIRHTAGA